MNVPAGGDSREATRWTRHSLNNDFIFGATYHGVSRIPKRLSYAIGWIGTWLACKGFKEATTALAENFRVMFPDKSRAELDKLVLDTYRSYARDAIDFICSLSSSRDRLAPLVLMDDETIVDRLRAGEKGVLLVTGHIGNWELGGVVLRKVYGYPLTVVAMDEVDPGVNAWRLRFRRSLGIDTIAVRRGMDTALQLRRLLSENRVVAMLFDRHLGKDRVEVEFFGRPTYFLQTPALVSYFTGAPLLPAFILRRPDGRFDARTGPAVYVNREGDPRESAKEATQKLATILEAHVRDYPHLWYQFYPYWHDGSAEPRPLR